MSAFEDFVNLELPKRPPMLTLANTGYDNDPNLGGAPAAVQNSPQGTYFFRTTGNILYVKNTSTPATWAVVGSGGAAQQIAPVAWHVETTGNDSTGDGTVGLPFATVNGALAKFRVLYGERIRYLFDILVGIGNFPGFVLQGWEVDPTTNLTPVGIRVSGTFVPAVPASGTASGTFTTVTTGNTVSDVVFSTLTDSAQSWPVDGLRGFMLEVLTGGSITAIVPILNNTATTLTIPLTSPFGSVGGTYAIRDFGTVITTPVPMAPSIPQVNALNQSPTPVQVGIGILNDVVAPQSAELRIENFKITPSSGIPVNVQGSSVTVARSFIRSVSVGCVNVIGGPGVTTFIGNIINPPTGATGVTSGGVGNHVHTQTLIAAGTPMGSTSSGIGINPSLTGTIAISNTQIEAAGRSILVSGSGALVMTLTGLRLLAYDVQALRVRNFDATSGNVTVFAFAVAAVSGPNSTSASVDVQGSATLVSLRSWFSSGGGSGITLALAATVRTNTLCTITGAAIGEILFTEVATTDNTTLAVLRAQPNKVLQNSVGSRIFETDTT